MTKAATGKLPPQLLFATELAAGTLTLWIWVLATDPFRVSLPTACRLALPGLLQPGLAFSLTFVALQRTTISNETLIWSTESVMMLVLASIILGQRLSRPLVLLSAVAFLGVAMMSLSGRHDPVFGSRSVLANTMIVLAVLAACAYTFLAERALVHLQEEQLFALHQTAGLLVAMVFALVEDARRDAGYRFTFSVGHGVPRRRVALRSSIRTLSAGDSHAWLGGLSSVSGVSADHDGGAGSDLSARATECTAMLRNRNCDRRRHQDRLPAKADSHRPESVVGGSLIRATECISPNPDLSQSTRPCGERIRGQ